jgi:hypothetical protein
MTDFPGNQVHSALQARELCPDLFAGPDHLLFELEAIK